MPEQQSAAAEIWTRAQLALPMALRVAATLRLADHLAPGPSRATDLAIRTSTDPQALERLLAFLAVRQIVARDQDDCYRLTELGAALRTDHPSGVRGWLDIDGAGQAELAFVHLLHSLRTGEAGYPEQFGRTLWEDLDADPVRADVFDSLMAATAEHRFADITAAHDWGAFEHVVDVGGGDGSLLAVMLGSHPNLRGTVLDRGSAVTAAKTTFAEAGLSERADVAAGSFFDPLPAGADAYLLSFVIHNWSDQQALALLTRCAEAAGESGTVFVIERLYPDGRAHTGMDLRMLVYCAGRERGLTDLVTLAEQAGLALDGVQSAGDVSLVRFRPDRRPLEAE